MTDDQTDAYQKTLATVESNDPPIEPNQTWSCVDTDGSLIRQLRILALHPDPSQGGIYDGQRQWIYIDTNKGRQKPGREISVLPEYNLRRIFALDS